MKFLLVFGCVNKLGFTPIVYNFLNHQNIFYCRLFEHAKYGDFPGHRPHLAIPAQCCDVAFLQGIYFCDLTLAKDI